MAKAIFEAADSSVTNMITKIINTFPDKFIHVVPSDLCVMYRDAAKSSFKAKTRVMSGLYQTLTHKKVLIEIHKQEWELSTENQRALLVYHELYHILFDDKKREYKMRKPDVKGFYDLLKTLGLSYENADSFFSAALHPIVKQGV